MNDRVREIARRLGADVVTQLPETAHGALGAAHYAHFYRLRVEQLHRDDPHQLPPTEPPVSRRLELVVSEATETALARIAELLGKIDQNANSANVAAELLESMVSEMTTEPSWQAAVRADDERAGWEPSTLGNVLWTIMKDILKRRKLLARSPRQVAG